MKRFKWILCRLGIHRACGHEAEPRPQDPDIEYVRDRHMHIQERLNHLGYYVDVYSTDHTSYEDESRDQGEQDDE